MLMLHRCFGLLAVTVGNAEPNPPIWPSSVHVFSPSDVDITETVASILKDLNNVTTGHYSNERLALLFKPGTYNASIEVGYYVQVLGLGERADDVVFTGEKGVHSYPMGAIPDPGSLDNFWRSAENFRNSATSGMVWAVSQACPIRRVHIDKNLSLTHSNGYASGGFMADMQVEGDTLFGGQQQWFTRNSALSSPDKETIGGGWNIVFVGTTGAPPTDYPKGGEEHRAITNIANSPVVAEKPYISIGDDGTYNLQIPPVKFRSVGVSLNSVEGLRTVPFNDVFVAKSDEHSASDIQAKIDQALHVVLAPGIYHLNATLVLKWNAQVLLGLGMATLLSPADGSPCVRVKSGISGVRVAGLMLQAAAIPSSLSTVSTLFEWGEPDVVFDGIPTYPGVMSDIFARVGGPDLDRSIGVDVVVQIHSGNVIGDNLWLWRADHALLDPTLMQLDPLNSSSPMLERVGKASEYYLSVAGDYPSKTGLEVIGNDVTMYGLFVEHHIEDNTVWKGDGGQVFFYQNEIPYDVTQESFCDMNYTGFRVADSVQSLEGFGMGVYSFFRDYECLLKSAFVAPDSDGVRFTNVFTRYLSGHSGILSILNGRGHAARGTWWTPGGPSSVMGRMPSSMDSGTLDVGTLEVEVAQPERVRISTDSGDVVSVWVAVLLCVLSCVAGIFFMAGINHFRRPRPAACKDVPAAKTFDGHVTV